MKHRRCIVALDDDGTADRGEKLTIRSLEIARAGSSPGTPADTIELYVRRSN